MTWVGALYDQYGNPMSVVNGSEGVASAESGPDSAGGSRQASDGRRARISAWRGRRWASVAAAILALGLAAGLAGALVWRSAVRSQEKATFQAAATDVSASTAALLRRDTDFVATLRAVLTMEPRLSASRFSEWFTRLEGRQRQVGGRGTVVTRAVAVAELQTFQAGRDADRAFRALVGGRVDLIAPHARANAATPSVAGPDYCLLSAGALSTPLSPTIATVVEGNWCDPHSAIGGFSAGGTSQAALMRSIAASGQLLAYPVTDEGARDFIIEGAFYRLDTRLDSVAQRRAATAGWVKSSFDIPTVIRSALGPLRGLSVTVFHSNPGEPSEFIGRVGASGGAKPFTLTKLLGLDGTWTVNVRGALSTGGLSADAQGLLVLLGGIILGALLSALVLVLGSSRERALGMVEQKTGELRHQALHDPLTGLPNRVLALDRAEQMLARARRELNPVAALCLDLDGFKHVNDTFGHAAGDELLRTVATRIAGVVRETDTAARLHDDEFLVLVEGSALDAGPELVAERLLDVLRQPYEPNARRGGRISLTASVGVASGPRGSAEELLRDADLALYQAKHAGKNRYSLFRSGMETVAQDRVLLEMDLAAALEHDQLLLHYQPLFDLRTETMFGVEALVRWRHPTRGVVSPTDFIPIAEQSELIVPIGRWVLHEACQQAAAWHRQGYHMCVSVNVSARQLDSEQLVGDVREALLASGIEPASLTLEITETTLMRDAHASAARLRAVKQLGVRIAIDDFGTGYSSLAYLRQFPADVLKIDRSFISAIAANPQSRALIQTLVQLGTTLGIETLAEGIENRTQLAALQDEHCDSGQGFLFSRPLDVDAMNAFLKACLVVRRPDQLAGSTGVRVDSYPSGDERA